MILRMRRIFGVFVFWKIVVVDRVKNKDWRLAIYLPLLVAVFIIQLIKEGRLLQHITSTPHHNPLLVDLDWITSISFISHQYFHHKSPQIQILILNWRLTKILLILKIRPYILKSKCLRVVYHKCITASSWVPNFESCCCCSTFFVPPHPQDKLILSQCCTNCSSFLISFSFLSTPRQNLVPPKLHSMFSGKEKITRQIRRRCEIRGYSLGPIDNF